MVYCSGDQCSLGYVVFAAVDFREKSKSYVRNVHHHRATTFFFWVSITKVDHSSVYPDLISRTLARFREFANIARSMPIPRFRSERSLRSFEHHTSRKGLALIIAVSTTRVDKRLCDKLLPLCIIPFMRLVSTISA